MNVSLLKQIIQEELAFILNEATHPWYTSLRGYYKDEKKAGEGPRGTGNVSQYLKPNAIVYNAKGESKRIKDVTSSHIQFVDGTEDYFMNWFTEKPDLYEESATGAIGVGAGPIQTPYAFAPKGQKKNKATKYAEKLGFKTVKGMPKNSKMLDYKELWKGKKSAMNENMTADDAIKQLRPLLAHTIEHDKLSGEYSEWLDKVKAGDGEILDRMWDLAGSALDKYAINTLSKINESGYDQPSKYGAASGYGAASQYGAAYKYGAASEYTKNESLINIVKEELLNEVSYNKFKNEVKYRTKAEMLHKSIREVKRKLAEVDQLIEYTTRIKQELSENDEGTSYWKRSLKAINEISEISNKISNKIKSIYQ